MGDPVIRTAQDVPIKDAGGFFTAGQVEGALQELGSGVAAATFAEDEFTPTNGQTVFSPLSATYVGAGGLSIVTINGKMYAEGTNYTISGTTLTWLDVPFTLETTDCLVVKFQTV